MHEEEITSMVRSLPADERQIIGRGKNLFGRMHFLKKMHDE
jgi:hypothetical protein